MNVENYESILNKLQTDLIANQDKLTDFNDGSIIETLLEGFAEIIESLYIDTRNGFVSNMKNIVYNFFNFQPLSGTKATGSVIFSRTKAIQSATDIPIGTLVKAGAYTFQTTSAGTIAAGQVDSGFVSVVATDVGNEYNVMSGAINQISSILSGDVVKVNNPNATSGGANSETEAETFERFNNTLNGLQGLNYYSVRSAILNGVTGIRKLKIKEHFPPVNSYNYTLYVYPDNQKSSVENIMKGNNTRANPGRKALGLNYRILAAGSFTQNVSYSIDTLTTDKNVTEEIRNVIQEVFNKLDIGDTLYVSDLLSAIKSLSFIRDVRIVEPANNVSVNEDTILTLGTVKEV